MSHHYSGPDFGFPQGDARLDLTDLYAFPKPGDAEKSVLIMNVHPSAVVDPPGPTTSEPFSPDALYEIRIDTDGDAVQPAQDGFDRIESRPARKRRLLFTRSAHLRTASAA
jgi:hypothetical protein